MVPEGYFHKATNESFNGAIKVSIYYSSLNDDFLLEINDGEEGQGWFFNKTQLELIVQAGKDVLDDLRV
jgi:hypothetical protein